MGFKVAIVGATGNVGREMLNILEERGIPIDEIVALASRRSLGTEVSYGDRTLKVKVLDTYDFSDTDICIMSAGGSVSKEWSPRIGAQGAVVIDNSSAWRMDPDVPLVVPEVNAAAIKDRKKGIIANPNCSTIQMLVALKPLHDVARIKHIVVSTYQATSGKGQAAVDELRAQMREFGTDKPITSKVFPGQIALNVLSDWKPGSDGYSEEELKLVHETRKIMGDPSIGVTPTCVRVPVVTGHSESVHVQFHSPLSAAKARDLLRNAPGVKLIEGEYKPGGEPQPLAAADTDPVYVGRVRDDLAVPGALNLWVVSDNLRKGAALNAVQIAELLV